MIKRVIIYHHFDPDNIIDDHVVYLLNAAKNFQCDIVFGSNSALTEKELSDKIRPLTNDITLRVNKGYDFASWKQMLLEHGREYFNAYDEVIVANSTMYGPLFPFEEIFARMGEIKCDFWAPTKHSAAYGIPEHVQPYFLVVRKNLLNSDAFWEYWKSIKEDYTDIWDAIWHGEIRLSYDFCQAGFTYATYADLRDYREIRDVGHHEPFVLNAASYLIETQRLPFVKVKAFYVAPTRPYSSQQFIFRALDATDSPYPRGLIKRHQMRTSPLSWSKNIDGTLLITRGEQESESASTSLKIGVFAHLFYLEKLDLLISYLANIPFPFDLNVTTPAEKIKTRLEQTLKRRLGNLRELDIRIVENRGRDIAPWITEFRDKHLSYDLGLKLHVKQHSQQPDVFSHMWNKYLFESMLDSDQSVREIVAAFEADERLGILFPTYPPFYNMMFPQGYYGTAEDQEYRLEAFRRLSINPPAESTQPIFSAGGMQWYRPKALSALFTSDITNEDFPPEPFPTSSTFGHGLERAIPYIAQVAGYSYRLSMPLRVLKDGFQMYEDRIMSAYVSDNAGAAVVTPTIKQSIRILIRALYRSYCARLPGVAALTKGFAERTKKIVLREG
ncbi:rhamnan synthesis F family protein [Mesorhizobium sp.]|uniref:rhamnan synthesis F family protein n=1 Tax=Mesorhizobium sp. TaxID=1871066 RepID=UPI0025E6A2AC|nr:rhamnan synthesis F family protein [Mesorhizobium sp.]